MKNKSQKIRPQSLGALLTVILAFPIAGVLTLVYRFPFPLAEGGISGWSAVGPAMAAVGMYGLLGGFFLLAILGWVAGSAVSRGKTETGMLPWKQILLVCLLIDFAVLFIFASSDKIFGPW